MFVRLDQGMYCKYLMARNAWQRYHLHGIELGLGLYALSHRINWKNSTSTSTTSHSTPGTIEMS